MCPLFGKILKETCTIYCFKILFQNCPLVVPVSSHRLSRDSLSLGHQGALFWSWPPDERIPKKALFFPLPFSILADTNLIKLLLFFFQPPFDSQENPPPFDFRENPSSFDFRGPFLKLASRRENPWKSPIFSSAILNPRRY